MKRALLICLCCCLFLAPVSVHGQKRVTLKKFLPKIQGTRVFRTLEQERISHHLRRRVHTSFKRAKDAQNNLRTHPFPLGEPIRRVRRAQDMPEGSRIYEDKSFLTTREQMANYMAAQSNRLFIRESKNMDAWAKQVYEHIPQMEDAARQTPRPEQPIAWLAQQIPAETTMLFVGEMHGFKEIREGVGELLETLRQQNPEREIILFTEFLPENFHWENQLPPIASALLDYVAVWQKASHNNIEIFGLEPQIAIEDTCEVEGISHNGRTTVFSQWAHLEGMRIRNESWIKTLQAHRAQHPDALFVVYTGTSHSSYYFPFSLSTAMQAERPFVAALYPDKVLTGNGKLVGKVSFSRHEEPLERLTKHVLFQQPVLQFKGPELPKLAGFDIRIKIPIDTERHAASKGL